VLQACARAGAGGLVCNETVLELMASIHATPHTVR
jgi:hypothetical protein